MGVETLPVDLVPVPSTPVGGADNVVLTITVDSAPTSATTVQVDCGDHSLLDPPSGSWPYQAPIAAGSTTATITIPTHSVKNNTSVQLRAGSASADMTSSSNWTATVSVTLQPPAAPLT